MKRFSAKWRKTAVLLIAGAGLSLASNAQTLGTNFTYQGVVKQDGNPVTGPVTVQFRLFSAASGGSPLFSTQANVNAANGLFSANVDFGNTAFDGDARWLEVVVDGNVLNPRQAITAAPYALKVPGIDGYSLNAADGTPVDAVYVDNAGNVGIGTTAPDVSLRVHQSTGHARVKVSSADDSAGIDLLSDNGGAVTVYSPNQSNDMRFYTNGADRMSITDAGLVGIGTAAPKQKLHVAGDYYGRGHLYLYAYEGDGLSGTALVQARDDSTTSNLNLLLRTKEGAQLRDAMMLSAAGNVGIGTNVPQAKLDVAGETRTHVLRITGGADLAEPFDVTGEVAPQPGMLVAIDPNSIGRLTVTTAKYDRTVAGVISGANQINPGMILSQEGSIADGKHPVALTGRVYVWCDADAAGPIQPGDLLTSSATAGHAMKAADAARAPGATIGKAMSPLHAGKGLVLVLVSLQ